MQCRIFSYKLVLFSYKFVLFSYKFSAIIIIMQGYSYHFTRLQGFVPIEHVEKVKLLGAWGGPRLTAARGRQALREVHASRTGCRG